jgi:hypothetical protein
LDWSRWALVVLLVVITVFAWLYNPPNWFYRTLHFHLKYCQQEVTRFPTHPVVQVCRSLNPTDVPVLLVLVGIVLLLLPDFSEVGIGSFSVKRALGRQREKQAATDQRVTDLGTALFMVKFASDLSGDSEKAAAVVRADVERGRRAIESGKADEFLSRDDV